MQSFGTDMGRKLAYGASLAGDLDAPYVAAPGEGETRAPREYVTNHLDSVKTNQSRAGDVFQDFLLSPVSAPEMQGPRPMWTRRLRVQRR